jgi:hypothetical protein
MNSQFMLMDICVNMTLTECGFTIYYGSEGYIKSGESTARWVYLNDQYEGYI